MCYTPDRQLTPDDDPDQCPDCSGHGKLSDCCDAPVLQSAHLINTGLVQCTECGRRCCSHECSYCEGTGEEIEENVRDRYTYDD